MRKWNDLPKEMQVEQVKKYYEILQCHKGSLLAKRIFDIIVASLLVVILSPILLLLSILIKIDSPGPVMFRQVRVTTYGKPFRIFKFRTMVNNADKIGTQVTTKGDSRVTRMGKMLRGCRLDELPQLFNVLKGEMSFVGTRPEVEKYVDQYSEEMMATLFLPAGITSYASIMYKDEDERIGAYQKQTGKSVDEIYREYILPEKMKYNLKYLKEFSIWRDMKLMLMTVAAVLK